MALRRSNICKAVLPIVIAAVMSAGCGEPQLNQSRQEPFFVEQDEWHSRYGPRLTVSTWFPDLAYIGEPRIASTAPSIATIRLDGGGYVILETGAEGEAEIELYDGDILVRSEPLEVVRPTRFAFDFAVNNQFAPEEAAIGPEETVAIFDAANVLSVVRFFGDDAGVGSGESIVGTGRIIATKDLLISLEESPAQGLINTGELRFRQLTTGDLISTVASGRDPIVVLEMPTGEKLALVPFRSTIGGSVVGLELVVDEQDGQSSRIAVFGKFDLAVRNIIDMQVTPSEIVRVLGLSPVVTLDGEPLRPFAGGVPLAGASVQRSWPWLFVLPQGAHGMLEARWQALAPVSAEVGQ